MRDILIILGMIVAAIAIGAGLYFYAPAQLLAPTTTQTAASNTAPQTQAVTFSAIDSGTTASSAKERKNYAAYTEKDFAKIWNMAHGTDGKVMPKVDFTKDYVIGVFAGDKPTGGYGISVASISDSGSARTVAVSITTPGAGCMTTEAKSSPYQMVTVPISDAVLAHTDTEVAEACK